MTTTPALRRSAAWLVTGLGAPTVTPGEEIHALRQAAGWGYAGVQTAEPPPPPPPPFDAFVYRNPARLRAAKIY